MSDLKLLVRMPTRGRPEQALAVLRQYKEMAGCPVALEVVLDEDDASMVRADQYGPAAMLHESFALLGATVTINRHGGKISAVNDGRVNDWDVLLLASDDMVPVCEGYGSRVLDAMIEHFPLLDGALWFYDGLAGICTLPIFGRRLYQQFGYVYYPEYKSFFCDDEQTAVLEKMGRLAKIDQVIIEHRHPAHSDPALRAPVDATYDRNGGAWGHDESIYRARKARGFDMPRMRLSILIATLPERAGMLRELTDKLWAQALAFPRQVEIIVDGGDGTTGAKRNRLLARSRGEFVAFVDDDDQVATDYVARILGALDAVPDADCVELHVSMWTAGGYVPAHCSIRYSDWSVSAPYTRSPHHLCPARRELALTAGFPDETRHEDYEYSRRLYPLLKKEAPTSGPLYFYYPSKP